MWDAGICRWVFDQEVPFSDNHVIFAGYLPFYLYYLTRVFFLVQCNYGLYP